MSQELSRVQQLGSEVAGHRQSLHPVTPLFLNRWSPRAYSPKKITEQELGAVLEAAAWAPSSRNDQPWRFVVASNEEQLALFHSFIAESNLVWCASAPVLVLIASDTRRDGGDPNGAHAFDAGAAWGQLAIQATILGLATHAIGGFDRTKARTALHVPEHFELHAVIAIGYPGDKDSLPEALRLRETPNQRKPLYELVFEGTF